MDNQPDPVDEFAEFRQIPETSAIRDDTEAAQPADNDASKFAFTVPTDGVDLHDHLAEERAVADYEKQEGGGGGVEKPEHEDLPLNNPGLLPHVGDQRREVMRGTWTGATEATGEVTVTTEEKDRFLRSALHDTPMFFEITVPATGIVVRLAMPADQYTSWTIGALKEWEVVGQIDKESTIQWVLGFQQLHAFLQVQSVDNVPVSWAEQRDELLARPAALYNHLRNPDNFSVLFTMNDVRWQMLAYALRVAEVKYKICTEALLSRDFFRPAGTD